MKYRLIDTFSGAGGMTLGFTGSRFGGGFTSIWGADNDPAAIETFNENFGDHAVCADLDEWVLRKRPIPSADVVIGGPPCQGFSLLNKNRIEDSRRSLWQPYMDVVERSGAKVFVIENVPGLLGSPEFEGIVEQALRLGFAEPRARILNSADYGVPQTRRRTVIIGWKKELIAPSNFPPLATHSDSNSNSNLPSWITVRDAIGDLLEPVGTEIRNEAAPYDLHFGRNPTELSKKRYRKVPPGGNRFDLQKNAPELTPQCWINKTSGGTDLFGRLWWDRPSVTIRTEFFKPEKGRYLHPVKHRPITHREAARLMGFPDDFKFVGSKIQIARQIGNAVPPPMAGAVAELVREMLGGMSRRKAA